MADPCLRQRFGGTAPKRHPTVPANSAEADRVQPPRRRAPRRLGLGLVAAVLLGACASSNSPRQEPASAPTPAPALTKPPAVNAPVVSLPADPKGKEPLTEPLVDPPPSKAGTAAIDAEHATGGDGIGEGIGLGSVGTIGHGAGPAAGAGFGAGHGRLGGSHKTAPPRGSAWGSGIGEAYGAGGLGLSGVGEGGGGGAPPAVKRAPVEVAGRAGASRDIARRRARSAVASVAQQSRDVKAGEWDDNANYREYLKYKKLEKSPALLDVRNRRFLVVRDAKNLPVPNCSLKVSDASGHTTKLTTQANGRAVLFPHAVGMQGALLKVSASCLGLEQSKQVSVAAGDGVLDFQLPVVRKLPDNKVIDVAFVLDTTGSMSEEISAMKDTLEKVSQTLRGMSITPRVGLVEYRDKGDVYLTRTHQMTTDISGFAARVAGLSAGGGGDMPEHVNEGLRVALTKLKWSDNSLGRLTFLIGDAPPQLDYDDDVPFATSIQKASERGIQLFTIAASGMDDLGQSVWRHIAMYTGATNLFVLRGGAGPQSVGAGDPKDSCGGRHDSYTSGNLAELISKKVQDTVDELDADPMRIAGLGKDENAKPCDQRVAQQ